MCPVDDRENSRSTPGSINQNAGLNETITEFLKEKLDNKTEEEVNEYVNKCTEYIDEKVDERQRLLDEIAREDNNGVNRCFKDFNESTGDTDAYKKLIADLSDTVEQQNLDLKHVCEALQENDSFIDKIVDKKDSVEDGES